MDPIYVTGHRNPDTDSIVAAMAYASLRNALGDREYEAACLGHVSDETQIVLDRFGFQPPKRIYNMFTQVHDLDFDTPPCLNTAVTVAIDLPVFEQQEAVTETQRQIQIVNDDHGDHIVLVAEFPHQLQHLVLILNVQRAGWLVQQQCFWLLRQGSGQHDLLLFAAGKLI